MQEPEQRRSSCRVVQSILGQPPGALQGNNAGVRPSPLFRVQMATFKIKVEQNSKQIVEVGSQHLIDHLFHNRNQAE